jgi:acetyl esterase/lipase
MLMVENAAFLKDLLEIPLWPGTPPGSAGLSLSESTVDCGTDPARPDRAVSGIGKPTLTSFLPEKPNGASLIICSGGGYTREVIDKEGGEIARRFNRYGFTAFVLKYRLPGEGHKNAAEVPLQDGQRAVRVVRACAAGWNLDPARVVVIGFSAGGHLASMLGTRFGDTAYAPADAADALACRPDAIILMYPVISMDEAVAHAGLRRALLGDHPDKPSEAAYSTDVRVPSDSPPTLIVGAGDDTLAAHGLRYYQALLAAGTQAELHLFMRGGHGFALRLPPEHPAMVWPDLARAWLDLLGIAR